MLTEKQLGLIFPRNRQLKKWVHPLAETARKFEINKPLRMAHFLAQLAVESNELRTLEENLHYSPRRIVEVWPKRFPTMESAARYARNPERLANFVYANRNGNGSESSRDGWNYRGRGAIQITGKSNYATVGQLLKQNLLKMPDMLLEPKWAALSAGAFWKRNGLNIAADNDSIESVTKVVTGGSSGLEARKRYLLKAKEVLYGIDGDRIVESVEGDQDDSPGFSGAPVGQKGPAAEASGWFD